MASFTEEQAPTITGGFTLADLNERALGGTNGIAAVTTPAVSFVPPSDTTLAERASSKSSDRQWGDALSQPDESSPVAPGAALSASLVSRAGGKA